MGARIDRPLSRKVSTTLLKIFEQCFYVFYRTRIASEHHCGDELQNCKRFEGSGMPKTLNLSHSRLDCAIKAEQWNYFWEKRYIFGDCCIFLLVVWVQLLVYQCNFWKDWCPRLPSKASIIRQVGDITLLTHFWMHRSLLLFYHTCPALHTSLNSTRQFCFSYQAFKSDLRTHPFI